ncbi:unnamed protein product, partial [marine sediment metagenome]
TNLGVRDHFKYKTAMFTNSLLLDFLINNGLATWKEVSTKDVVCLEFTWGSRSYNEEIKHLTKLIKKSNNGDKVKKLKDKIEKVKKNEDKYIKKTKGQIRNEYYENGVDIKYITKNKKGKLIKEETIHYKKLYRTTGKAKKGSCVFIRDELYEKAYNFLTMGLEISDTNTPIVELSAYIPLVTSTIVDKIKINPKNILILKDIDSFFKTKVVSVETEDKQCIAKTIEDYTVKNTLFDGQALVENSIFPE